MVYNACCSTWIILYQEKYIFVLTVGNTASSFNLPAGGPEALFAVSESCSGCRQNRHALHFTYTDTLRPVWSTILTLNAWSNRLTDLLWRKNFVVQWRNSSSLTLEFLAVGLWSILATQWPYIKMGVSVCFVRRKLLNVLKTPLRMKWTSRTWPDKERVHWIRNEHETDTNR